MKTMVLSFFILYLAGCEKGHDKDYRDIYIGEFEFKTIEQNILPDQSYYDTIIYNNGKIKKFESDKLQIIHQINYIDVTHYINTPTISNKGKLINPEYLEMDAHNDYYGQFLNSDSLQIELKWGSNGAGVKQWIFGKRKSRD